MTQSEPDASRMVLIYGAETRLGGRLVRLMQDCDQCCIPRSSDYHEKDVVKQIHSDIRQKKPAVVVNCLVDVDSGMYPTGSVERYLAPTLAMLQQCRITGSRYIFCSSSRVFGQQESVGAAGYGEYDPWMAYGDDQWRAIAQSAEASLWQQTSFASLQAKAETHTKFEFYCLRFGHLLHTGAEEYAMDANPLSVCVRAAINGQQAFVCGRPRQSISPITTTTAAKAILELCGVRPRPVSGTYNIGSKDTATVQGLFDHIAMRTGVSSCVGAMCGGSPSAMEIYGVDADQALDTGFWSSRARTELPTWKATIEEVIKALRSPQSVSAKSDSHAEALRMERHRR